MFFFVCFEYFFMLMCDWWILDSIFGLSDFGIMYLFFLKMILFCVDSLLWMLKYGVMLFGSLILVLGYFFWMIFWSVCIVLFCSFFLWMLFSLVLWSGSNLIMCIFLIFLLMVSILLCDVVLGSGVLESVFVSYMCWFGLKLILSLYFCSWSSICCSCLGVVMSGLW